MPTINFARGALIGEAVSGGAEGAPEVEADQAMKIGTLAALP